MTTQEMLDKAIAALEYGIDLRVKKTVRLSRRTGLKPGDPRMREHVRRMELRNFFKVWRALQRAN